MNQVVLKSRRDVVMAMSEEEQKEALKGFPTALLYNELEYRALLNEEKLNRVSEVMSVAR